jgi:O-antigen ligase
VNPPLAFPRDLRAETAGLIVAVGGGGLIAVAPHALVFAGAVFAIVAMLTAWRTSFGLGALLLTVPVQTSVTLDFGARHLTFTKIALAAVVVGWFANIIFGGERPKLNAVSLAFIAYLCALVASSWNARNDGAWAGEIYRWLTAGLVYVIASSAVRRRNDLVVLFGATAAAVMACAAAAIVQVQRHSGPPSFTVGGVTRAFGAFGEPNPFAAYFEIAALPLAGIALAMLLGNERCRNRVLMAGAGLAGLAGALGVYLTHSRGGAIGAAAGVFVIALLADRRLRTAVLALVGLAAVALTLTGAANRAVDRFDALAHDWNSPVQVTSANFSVEERVAHWGAAVRMWEAHPIIGVGAGNFNDNFRVYTPVWRFRIPRGHAHDGYLQAAAQAGSIGLIAYLSLLGAALVRAGRALSRSKTSLERGVAVGAIGATIAVMVHGVFDYLHVLNLGLQLSVVWASVEYVSRGNQESKGNHDV